MRRAAVELPDSNSSCSVLHVVTRKSCFLIARLHVDEPVLALVTAASVSVVLTLHESVLVSAGV